MSINEGCQMNSKGCSKKTDQKLDTFDWLCDIPESLSATDLVEVTFKNTRKGYYRNTNDLTLQKGDIVAVEATPGHDIGTVSMTGQLVLAQMKKYHVDQTRVEIKRIYRIARPNDIEKYEESKAKEHDTMLRARKIAEDLHLNMKIGDVEYQGDGNKAIFYYIADERVDFRELIKVLADTFRVRIEMKQIGARQEAGRIGGIGPCGRPLCCSSWMTKFSSVATSSARYQEISLNPQKLAGQCAKLKCCLNFEIDAYVEAQRGIPDRNIQLETIDGTYYHFKTDVFGQIMQYSSSPSMAANIVSIPVSRVKEIIALNKKGIKVESLLDSTEKEKTIDYENVVGQDSLTRFDRKKKKKKKGGNDRAAEQQENTSAEGQTTDSAQSESQSPASNSEGNARGAQGSSQQTHDRDDRNNRRRDNRDRRDRKDNRERRSPNSENPDTSSSEGASNENPNAENRQQPRENREPRPDNRNRGSRNENRGPRDNNRGPRNNDRNNRGPKNDTATGNGENTTKTPQDNNSVQQPQSDNHE